MSNKVEVLVQPVTIRFSLYEDEMTYHFAAGTEAQLDDMEKLMKVDVENSTFITSNVGFLPVSSIVLIQGEKNIIVDPGNHHVGFYGMLASALKQRGLTTEDIDIVIITHWHHDHFSNITHFPGKTMVIGEGELDVGRQVYGEAEIEAKTTIMKEVIETPHDKSYKVAEGVEVVYTPGHTPHSISVVVEEDEDITAIVGDLAMTRKNFEEREFSHWYDEEQIRLSNEGIEEILAYQPTKVIPGHDRVFKIKK